MIIPPFVAGWPVRISAIAAPIKIDRTSAVLWSKISMAPKLVGEQYITDSPGALFAP
jgi:hypothetical protein